MHQLKHAPDRQRDFAGNFDKFYSWGQEQGVDFTNSAAVKAAIGVYFGGGETGDLMKYSFDMSDRPDAGWLYTDGPFTYNGMQDGIFNQAISGGSQLAKWIPVERMESKVETMAYLDYVVPRGWDGQSYLAFLNSLTVNTCEYGPSTAWHGHEAQFGFGEWSVSTETMTKYDFGLPKHRNTPMMTIRGSGEGAFNGTISNDADWATAQLAVALEQHYDYIMRFGTLGGNYQMDGLANVISAGYIDSHIIGGMPAIFSDPLMYDGSGLTTIQDILEVIRATVRKIVKRATQRRWSIAGTDMAVVMPSAFVDYIVDAISCGANTSCNSSNLSFVINDIREERRRTEGGLGWGEIEVGNMRIPIISDDGLGTDYTLAGQHYTSGDIYILTRRVNGVNLLAQQPLNWNMLDLPEGNWWLENGGITRAGWVNLNESCWYGFAEQAGRLICRMEPLQGRIMSVSVAQVLENASESGFLNDSFFALQDTDPLQPWHTHTP